MHPIYKIGILIIILLIINHLHPLKDHFNINNLTNPFIKIDNKQINIIHKFINNLIIKNINYDELINYKWNIRPTPINNILQKLIVDYILTVFNNSKFSSYNIKLLNNIEYYNSHKGNYIPNIKFKITIKNNEEYTYIMELELFLHNTNKIDIINLKINDIINPNQNNESNIDSIFIKAPIDENYSEDSLIPTINNISD